MFSLLITLLGYVIHIALIIATGWGAAQKWHSPVAGVAASAALFSCYTLAFWLTARAEKKRRSRIRARLQQDMPKP